MLWIWDVKKLCAAEIMTSILSTTVTRRCWEEFSGMRGLLEVLVLPFCINKQSFLDVWRSSRALHLQRD